MRWQRWACIVAGGQPSGQARAASSFQGNADQADLADVVVLLSEIAPVRPCLVTMVIKPPSVSASCSGRSILLTALRLGQLRQLAIVLHVHAGAAALGDGRSP